ncbi:TrmH family RNA methyltransferase [Stakelama tenebrarum]|uniref:GIY-YIG nuclease family protein n=1 Tax=Stakelama tenebrarum TaxID=2711215 RepID=A0A6G6YB11_9SPHN|nr:TrmH family RNA methyltransferase [Sphingosinithalassobacter tenebrarum]QIG81766.1 GIY-YIG nuclease family protein [Sphingosinithalassobacter tenebrarum]
MMFWVYILRCSDGSYYTGHTEDLDQRMAQHHAGAFPGYTSERRPVELVFSEYFQTRDEALNRERQIKDWSVKKKEALIRGDWEGVSSAARSRQRVSTSLDARSNQTGGEDNSTPPPAIVLVRPQLGENIGKTARAMLNFGLTEMRLVSPRDGWPNPSAGPAASGADIVLEKARIFESVADAVADCTHVYATTVRKRGVTKPVVKPDEAAQAIHAAPGKSAILFGPERSGLETDDVAVAGTIVTVPINAEFGSLNLAQAVILVAYEWSKQADLVQPTLEDHDPPAPQGELDGMIAHLDAMLEASGFYHPPERTPATRRTLRTLLTKPGWSSQELKTLRGVLSALEGKKQRRS